ncbi:MAG: response regulator [Rubripirellula sp.]|nr:response regulator [Rubripirellula sp.]
MNYSVGLTSILVVDDDPIAAEALRYTLTTFGYDVTVAGDGIEALAHVRTGKFRIVISDVEMPEMSGIDLCREVRKRDACGYTYMILLTGRCDTDSVVVGLNAGADDYIAKPFHPSELQMRIRTGERLLALESRDLMIFALAKLADRRDHETGGHLERIREYSRLLSLELATDPEFSEEIDEVFIQLIYDTSPLHDIGKVGIPDRILLKPGRLTEDEFAIMAEHAQIGGDTLKAVAEAYPKAAFLQMAHQITISHHERWDGSGYPNGLAGRQIPLPGRIVAMADVYDALTSQRVYKSAYPHHVASKIIQEGSGSHFEPRIVEAFLTLEDEFLAVKEHYDQRRNKASDQFLTQLPPLTIGAANSPEMDRT